MVLFVIFVGTINHCLWSEVSIWLWRDRYGWKLILFISIFGGLHALLLGRHLADRTQAVGTNKFHIFTKQSILSPFSAPFLMLYTDVVNIVAGLKMASGRAQTVFPQLSEAHVNSYELSTVWPINSSDVKISGTAKSSSEKPKVSLSRGCYHTVFENISKSLFDQKFAHFCTKNDSKWASLNVARFARNVVKCDIFDDFQTMWIMKVHVRSYFHNSYLLKRFRVGESSLSISLSNHFY